MGDNNKKALMLIGQLKAALAAAPAPDDERERLLVAWSATYCGGMYPEHCPDCPERRNCKIHAALHSK